MYSKILVPLDGSRLSEGILPYARSLAKAFKIPIDLLLVIDPETISTASSPGTDHYLYAAEANMKKNRSEYLDETVRFFLPSLTVNCSVETGYPAEAIVYKASAHADTLVAMSTHGRSGVQRWFIGSVADKVLHICTNPLLLVRTAGKEPANEQAGLKTVIVPLDGSPLAELVLPHVTAMAKEMDLAVVLVRAYSNTTEAYSTEGHMPDIERLLESLKEEVKDYLEKKVQQLRDDGINKVSYVLAEGEAAGKIIDLARETPENLVAMCTHGRSGVGRWFLGSVTDRVVRHSGDPVLVIRAERKD